MDHDSLDRLVVDALRVAGVDVLTSAEVGRHRASDEDQLAFATSEGRVIFTANQGDFARLHRRWMNEGKSHAGIVIRPWQQMPAPAQVRALLELRAQVGQGDLKDALLYL